MKIAVIGSGYAAVKSAKGILADSIAYAHNPYAAAKGADALLILTEWKEFAALDLPRLRELLNYPIVLDGRNLFRPEAMAEAGLNYYSVGRSPVLLPNPSQTKVTE